MSRMLRSCYRWFRRAAPPEELLVPVVLAVALYEIFCLGMAWAFDGWNSLRVAHVPRDMGLMFAAGLYGIWRVASKHPAFRPEYRTFLSRTPWRRGQPLPLGPVHLVVQDGLVLGAFLAVSLYEPHGPPAAFLGLFLFAYLVTLCCALLSTGQIWLTYVVLFGMAVAIRLAWFSGAVAGAVLVATYLVSAIALWRSWRDFPWEQPLAEFRSRWKLKFNAPTGEQTASPRGSESESPPAWPYGVLGAGSPRHAVSPLHAWIGAGLLGLWIYALSPPSAEPAEVHKYALLVCTCGAWLIAGWRLAVYVNAHASPLTLFGRLWTGRLIIPRYDVVVLTPLAVATLGTPLYGGLLFTGLPAPAALSITAATLLGIALTGPPRQRHWQLTAPLRLVPSGKVKARMEEI
jgi:hypothetical protein